MTLARTSTLAMLLVGGCISVPDGPSAMCKKTSDCEGSEVCEEGICWGDPPAGDFAAVISPPTTRHDLVPLEIAQLALPPDGWMGDLTLASPAVISGKVTAFCPPPMTTCDTGTLPATITVTRHSTFRGGPAFKTAISVAADAESFEIPVPAGGDAYTVTIVPDGRGDSPSQTGTSAAQLVPPLQLEMAAAVGIRTFALGGADLPVISGTLTNSLGQGLAMYRVAAIGRWDPSQAPVEVSTVDYTDSTGMYAVTLSDGLVGSVEIVAKPYSTTLGPTIHITNIDATKSSMKSIVMPSNLGHETPVTIPVNGVDNSGTISPVRGARVSLEGVVQGNSANFTISDEATTDDDGNAHLVVLDGTAYASTYKLSIVPPASSSLGVMFDEKVTLNTVLPAQRLPARVALRGKIRDASGHPLSGVSVTARPSLRFLWTLDATPQTFVAAIPAGTTVTPDSGDFAVFVDVNVADTWARYDLVFEPPAGARAPSFTLADVEIPRMGNQTAVDVGDLNLPDAAFVHGRIADPLGGSLEDGELKLYRVTTDLALCTQVAHAPTSCPIPAQLQGRNTSDTEGTVRLTLPR